VFKILITDDIGAAGLALLEVAKDVQIDVVKLPSREKLLELIPGYDAVITRSGTALPGEIFEAAARLKVAGRAAVGLDNVDVEAATMRGILVMNTPESNTLAATEMTLAGLLALCRHLPAAQASVRAVDWTR
jgi:D-3-phosphoglycerate dehydrogenase / 2-oxoglutarate reductase